MPIVPVPRWLPCRKFAFTRKYFDALPKGWGINQIPTSSDPQLESDHYRRIALTQAERDAGLLLTDRQYGPSNGIGIWREVPRSEWLQLDTSRLHRVVTLEARYDQAMGARSVCGGWWRLPDWWQTALDSGTVTRTRRVDWDTTVTDTIIEHAPQTLAELFGALGIPYTYQEVPDPEPDYGSKTLGEAQKTSGWDSTSCTVEQGFGNEAIGYPLNNEGDKLALIAKEAASVGTPGEVCFECDRLDLFHVYELIRIGPPFHY